MVDFPGNELSEEQQICLSCGFCCDGTLFPFALLLEGERGNLPEELEKNSYTKEGKDYFKQPCPYYKQKCTIYSGPKANVCSSYRCELLKNFANGKLSLPACRENIENAGRMRDEILILFRKIKGEKGNISFSHLRSETGKMRNFFHTITNNDKRHEILIAKINILESLFIKHFRPPGGFDKLMMHSPEQRSKPL